MIPQVTEHMMSIIIGTHMNRFKREYRGRVPRDVYPRVCQMFKELGFNGTIANGFILGAWAGDADMQELLHKTYIHYRMTRPMPLVWPSGGTYTGPLPIEPIKRG